MYFESRWQAGELLARELFDKYRYEDCAVIALNDGGILVGEQIAEWLHSTLALVVSEDIAVPGEGQTFGAVSQDGTFTYNSAFSSGEIDEYTSEFHGYLDEQKREAFQKINRLLGDGGTISLELLSDRNVILVSDGFENTMPLQMALDFLKPVRYKKLIVAAPVISVEAVDTVHMMADEIHFLDVKQNYLGTDHYYTDNVIPTHEEAIKKINEVMLRWQ